MKKLQFLIIVLLVLITILISIGCNSRNRPSTGRVMFYNGKIKLAGNLWIPMGKGPFPAIVFIHGAGKITSQDYKYLSFFFINHGFATLIYDKRGVGESGGSYSQVDIEKGEVVLEGLAGDAFAAVMFLKNNKQIDPDKIGFFGISQGGWIAPLAASKSSDVAFITLFSGPVCSVGQELYYSKITGHDPGGSENLSSVEEASNRTRDQYTGTHGFDPYSSLENLDIPILWLFGSQDKSIPVALSVENITSLVKQHNKDFTYIVYPNAHHSLRDANTEQFYPAMKDALDWMIEKIRK